MGPGEAAEKLGANFCVVNGMPKSGSTGFRGLYTYGRSCFTNGSSGRGTGVTLGSTPGGSAYDRLGAVATGLGGFGTVSRKLLFRL